MSPISTRRRDRHPDPLSEGGAAYLDQALADLADASIRSFVRRSTRLAVTFRPCLPGIDAVPEERLELEDFRLFAVSHRWVERHGRVAGVVVLGVYKPEVDLPGTGRIRFRCDGVMPVGRKAGGPSPDPRVNPTAASAAALMAQVVEDADEAELATAVKFPRFFYAFGDRRVAVRESHVSPEEWAAGETRIGDLWAWPAEFFVRSADAHHEINLKDRSPHSWPGSPEVVGEGTTPGSAQQPDGIYADLNGLTGRTIRNPAWQVLRQLGVIAPDWGYRGWLESTCPQTRAGRRYPAAGTVTVGSTRFLADLAAWVDADPSHAAALLAALGDACVAAGVPVPADPDAAYTFLAGLAEAPWEPVTVPGVAAIQRIRLSGPPSPDTLAFAAGVVEADLHDLGLQNDRYLQVPDRRVREMFRQRGMAPTERSGRGRHPQAEPSL